MDLTSGRRKVSGCFPQEIFEVFAGNLLVIGLVIDLYVLISYFSASLTMSRA